MKLALTKSEKKDLIVNKSIVIERELRNEPNSSIIFGIGTKHVWDKIDRCWVFGDTEGYVESKKNVGRRAIDYPNNTGNNWNGNNWWECNFEMNPFGAVNESIVSGRKNPILFKIDKIYFDRFVENFHAESKRLYLRPVLKIEISLC